MDIKNLKSKIISVQAERDRLSMLLSEYVRDLVLIRGEHAVNYKKNLYESLLIA